MDVPLALNDIGIQKGLKGYKRKSSTFSSKTAVVGLSVLWIDFGNYLTH
jgi:hypothetical protein